MKSNIFWATDIHLDTVEQIDSYYDQKGLEGFINSIKGLHNNYEKPVLIVTGDISNGKDIVRHLQLLDSAGVQIYFVLGNHDFYESSFETVRKDVSSLNLKNVVYLTSSDPIQLDNETVLVGVDGWYDARVGNPHGNFTMYSDWTSIKEYGYRTQDEMKWKRDEIISLSRRFAEGQSLLLKKKLQEAVKLNPKKIIVATHIPPIPEVSLHNGRMSTSDSGWYVSKATFEGIRDISFDNHRIEFNSLSGHSHSEAAYQFDDNLYFFTRGAKYGFPDFVKFEF